MNSKNNQQNYPQLPNKTYHLQSKLPIHQKIHQYLDQPLQSYPISTNTLFSIKNPYNSRQHSIQNFHTKMHSSLYEDISNNGSPKRFMRLIQYGNQGKDKDQLEEERNVGWEQSQFIRNYNEKLKKQRKRLAKKNRRVVDGGKLGLGVSRNLCSSQQPRYMITLSKDHFTGNPQNKLEQAGHSNFNWPTKKSIPKSYLLKRKSISPDIHPNRLSPPKYKTRSQTPNQLPNNEQQPHYKDNPKKNYYYQPNATNITMTLGLNKYTQNFRVSPQRKKKQYRPSDLHKFDVKKLTPWRNQEYVFERFRDQRVGEFGIQDYYGE